jgi:sugar/nucleoside kinase (ribokinase family)
MVTPNEDELIAMVDDKSENENDQISQLFSKGLKTIWLRKGKKGSVIISNDNSSWSLPANVITVSDSTGAGDSALAGWMKLYAGNREMMDCMKAGHSLAYEVLQQKGAVIQNLSVDLFYQKIKKYYPDVE